MLKYQKIRSECPEIKDNGTVCQKKGSHMPPWLLFSFNMQVARSWKDLWSNPIGMRKKVPNT